MKKILVVNDLVQGGGVEYLMRDFIMHWHDEYDTTVLTIINNYSFYKIYPGTVKHLYIVPQYDKKTNIQNLIHKMTNRIRYIIKFLYIKKSHYDIILAMKEGRVMRLASKFSSNVKLAWVHLDYRNRFWTDNLAYDKIKEINYMRKYNHIVCVSEYIKNSIIEVIGDPGNLETKYNPIKVEEIKEKAKEICDDIETKKTVLRFITIGRLDYQKGYDMLLEACARLESENLFYELWIIGEGEDEAKLRKQIYDDNIKHVKLLGYKENPYKYLVTADWFISSSRYEGYSLVTQEAAVLDVPIIATDCSGVRELLGQNAEYGIIIDISVQSIYEEMKKVILNSELREVYSKLITKRKNIINFDERMNAISDLISKE